MDPEKLPSTIVVNAALSVVAFGVTMKLIPGLRDMFLKANICGVDMSKRTKVKIPEAQGVVCGAVFLCVMFLFIPIPFYEYMTQKETLKFPFSEYVQFLAALLSICCMIFLGFADDVLDLKWRHKLLLPTIASLPLLMVYLVTFDLTIIIVPKPFRALFGFSLDIGILYYLYMGMLAVFATNAINILAGINGIEAGQGLIIGVSVLIFNLIELDGDFKEAHIFSMYFMLPYIAVSLALLYHNWYPSSVFVGDTYCYFSGMTFAVVAILGHFSKTMLLFMIPQVVNFILSAPQIFKFVPCPRHRLPKYNAETDTVSMSYSRFKPNELRFPAHLILKIFSLLGLTHLRNNQGSEGQYMECSNLTIINLALRIMGPMNEGTLTTLLLCLQVFSSIVALVIRYPLAKLVYDSHIFFKP